MRSSTNILLIFVVLLYNWVADEGIRLMITETYSEPSRTVTMWFFAKAVNYFSKKAQWFDWALNKPQD